MLEKIGLPAKPSMRGANWVIDASHCQGCSSPFTFLNRKHHCRRCGGIFCNNCTQQRMVLRGQGDSPVRICDPCKKLEEAIRFEQRYGHKNRVLKGGSKQIQKTEDELLGEILGTDGKHSTPSRKNMHLVSDLPITEASSSIVSYNSGGEGDCSNSVEGHNDALIDIVNTSPEDLRQKAVEEKRMYKILKAEGKAEEALKAFKHGKELERQAGALELAIRKNRRMAAKVSNLSGRVSTDGMDDHEALSGKKRSTSLRDKEVKGDLFTELRELGWVDADLHDADKKPAKLSLEGELSNLLGDTFHKSEIGRKKGGIDKTQVVVHKRKALLLKKEGKLSEAKEELKQAKILEKRLEEQEFLAEASDSEDELSTIINSIEDDNQDGLLLENAFDVGANFGHFLDATDDLPIDSNLEVTDDDMNDPKLAAALKSFGWTEKNEEHELNHAVSSSQEVLQAEVLNLKKEALNEKRSGNLPEAMALLKKAKLLEQNFESIQSEAPGFAKMTGDNQISAPKSKMVIQKELLALKKKALALRREGRLEEAEEELKKGKVLEQQLEEFNNASTKPTTRSDQVRGGPTYVLDDDSVNLDLGVDEAETNVTDQDMHDPAMLSDLKNLGWNDNNESDTLSTTSFDSKLSKSHSVHESVLPVIPWKVMRNKAEIQRELLAIKRKALALRRQGKAEEAEEELERAKDLEKQMQELEAQASGSLIQQEKPNIYIAEENVSSALETDGVQRHVSSRIETSKVDATEKPPERLPTTLEYSQQSLGTCNSKFEVPKAPVYVPEVALGIGNGVKENADNNERVSHKEDNIKSINNESNGINVYKEEILAHKRNALALKKKGKLTEAKEELRKARLLEKSLEEGQENSIDAKPALVSTHESTSVVLENRSAQSQKPISGRDRFKLQQESLAHKRSALKLRREGKLQESEAEFQKAKELENQLEELSAPGSSTIVPDKDVIVEDLLDPQLMSALKSIGWNDNDMMAKPPNKPESQSITEKVVNQSRLDRTHLQEQIKAEKLRALNLKRSGNQDQALEALRAAKKLEKKLDSLT